MSNIVVENKILIIANNPLSIIGGTEKYNNVLVNILKKYYPNIEIHIAIIDNKNISNISKLNDEKNNIFYHFINFNIKNNNSILTVIN